MPRPLAVLLTAAAASAMLLLPAQAASAAPAPGVSPSTVQRGGSITVSGTGCVDPDYDPDRGTGRTAWWVAVQTMPFSSAWTHALGSVQTDEWDGGTWSVTLHLPPDTVGPGSYAVYARCSAGPEEFDYPAAAFTVVGDPIPPNWWDPGGSGPPGQPKGPSPAPPGPPKPAAPSPGQRTGPTATSAVPPAAPSAPATTAAQGAPATASAFAAVPGCVDCGRIAGDDPLRAGDQLTLTYAGFQPGEEVTIVMRSTPVTLGTFTADASGIVTADVTIPASAEAGSHTLTFSGPVTGDQVVRLRLAAAQQNQERAAAAPAAEDPDRTLRLALGGAVIVLSAGGLVLYRRRLARSQPAPAAGSATPDQLTATPISEPIT